MLNASLILLSLASLICMALDVKKYGVALLFYPFAWLLLFSIAYFTLPAIVVEDVSYYYDWYFGDDVVFVSKLASFYLSLLVFVFYQLFFSLKISPVVGGGGKKLKSVVVFLSFAVITYLSFVAVQHGVSSFFTLMLDGYQGDQSISENSRIKTIAYISIPLIVILIFHKRTSLALIIALLIVFIDMSQGGRTTALIPIVSIYMSYCYVNKKTYLGIAMIAAIFLYSIGIFFRPSEILAMDVIPAHISTMGEFRETFQTFPYVVNKNISGDFFNIPISILFNLVGPLRVFLMETLVNPGAIIENHIGRGYGLGFNFLTEAFYYFGFFGLLFLPVLLVALVAFFSSFLHGKSAFVQLVLMVSFVLIIRLVMREGLFFNIGLFFYLSFFLCALPVFVNRLLALMK